MWETHGNVGKYMEYTGRELNVNMKSPLVDDAIKKMVLEKA